MSDLTEITHHVQQANAALTALACGMRHDGVVTGDRERLLSNAIDHITHAYLCAIPLTFEIASSKANTLNSHENV